MLVLPSGDTNITDHDATFSCTVGEVRDELSRILSDALFDNSTILSSFLKFIVEEVLSGNARNLKEYTIGVTALGRRPDFNPKVDAIVRIHAGRLRRLLDEYYAGPGLLDPIQIDVVKGSYVPVFRRRVVPGDVPLTRTLKPIYFTRHKICVAVLPFRNLSEGNEFQFFADGVGEELTRVFGGFQEISVIAHQSTLRFALLQTDVRTIGGELGAHYLISGSVFRGDGQVRINVNLIETTNGTQVWANTYTFQYSQHNLIQVQDELTMQVFAALGGYYGQIIKNGAIAQRMESLSHVDAVDAVLWNYYFHMTFSLEAFLKTREMLEVAARHDPHNATGMAALADLYLIGHALGFPVVDSPVAEAMKLLQKAMALDGENQFAWIVCAWGNLFVKKTDEVLRGIDQCLALDPPSPSLMSIAGFVLVCVGQYDRGFQMLNDMKSTNMHQPWWFDLGFFLTHIKHKDYQKAHAMASRINVPDVFFDPLVKLIAYHKLEMVGDARQVAEHLKDRFPFIANNLQAHLSSFLNDDLLVAEMVADAAWYIQKK